MIQAAPHPSDPLGSGHDSRAFGTSTERSTRFRARTAGLRYLIRAIRQVQGTIRGLAVPHPSDPPGSGHDSRACGTSSERSAKFRARFAGLRYLIRAIRQVQGTIRGLAVPHPSDPPSSGHDSRACGTSSERSAKFRARFAGLRYLIRAIRQVQGTIRGLAVPHPSDPPSSGHDSRACGTSSERSAKFRARFAGLRYLIRAIRQVQGTIRGLAVPHPSDPLGSGYEPRAYGTSGAPSTWNHYRFGSKCLGFVSIQAVTVAK
ncbi:hypothetical protein [Ammoniphilus sp. YIM 78166]|uniref:hypothetical protein n=1 Tax=Ammoniphilus sp. YIM 78166 TaxID=1644106 RepID=UPI001430352B|nr:hypothetical protein [Ammoniphilus sp. YIM 78166]